MIGIVNLEHSFLGHLNQNSQVATAATISATNNNNKCNNVGLSLNTTTASGVGTSTSSTTNPTPITSSVNEELRYHGTELVMLYDYKVRNI